MTRKVHAYLILYQEIVLNDSSGRYFKSPVMIDLYNEIRKRNRLLMLRCYYQCLSSMLRLCVMIGLSELSILLFEI